MMGTVVYLHGDRQLNRCVHIFDRLMISRRSPRSVR